MASAAAGFAQAPATIAALDEAASCQQPKAAQHRIEVHSGLDGDRRGADAAARGERVEHPGAVVIEIIT